MIGVGAPWGALGLVAVAALILLLRLRRRTRTVPVSSLLLWRTVPARPVERRRGRPDLLFWLQLALVLVLVGALVRPWVRRGGAADGGTPLVVVVDCAASMAVREADGVRFARARAEAAAAVHALAPGAATMLIAATPVPRVVLRWTTEHAAADAALAALAPLDAAAALPPAVSLARAEADARGARVLVVSDRTPDASGVDAALRARVDWIAVGRRGDNVGITALAVDAPPLGTLADAAVSVVVRSFDTRPRTVTLTATIDGAPWTRHELALAPGAEAPLLLTDPPHGGVVRVALDGDDALAADDVALGWLPPPRPLDLVVVTDADALGAALRAVLGGAGDANVEVVNRAGWVERGAARAGAVALFDGIVPAEEPTVPALYVAPPPGNPRCPAADMVDGASVVDWEVGHPALGGLDALAAIDVARASRLLAGDWGTPLVWAASRRAAFPFLVVGERAGRRVACLAGELPMPLATSEGTPLLLLLVGTLRWLDAPADAPVVVATGTPVDVGDAAGAASDDGLRVAHAGGTVVAERVGAHHVRTTAGGERLVLANLLDAGASAVGRDGGGRWPATAAPPAGPHGPPHRELTGALEWLALAAAALEWTVWRRRR